jgi:hypothetical protein
MKKIIFFSRCELVHLYGRIAPKLKNHFDINHLAFSKIEKKILEEEYNIENVICLQEELGKIYKSSTVDYQIIQHIDTLIINKSDGQFCLNGAIQSDRTFEFNSYDENLHLCQSYYLFWNEYFDRLRPNFLIHEPVALFMTQIASYLISEIGGEYIANIQVIGENDFNWIFVKGISGELYVSDNDKKEAVSNEAVHNFIDNYRKQKSSILFSQYSNGYYQNERYILMKCLRFVGSIIKLVIYHIFKNKTIISNNPLNHIENFMIKYQPNFLDQIRMRTDRFFFLKYDEFELEKQFYYYPIHMEPEATVLYWACGFYKNQVKLIENIAAQLPPNVLLYVKDHPHGIGNRNFLDYKRIKSISNVKLIDPKIPGVDLVKASKGVITINGTGGFEGYLLGKNTITFGSNFYTKMTGIISLNHIKDLRFLVYNITEIEKNRSYSNYIDSLKLYLSQINKGFTDYFVDYVRKTRVDEDENAKIVAEGFINKLK